MNSDYNQFLIRSGLVLYTMNERRILTDEFNYWGSENFHPMTSFRVVQNEIYEKSGSSSFSSIRSPAHLLKGKIVKFVDVVRSAFDLDGGRSGTNVNRFACLLTGLSPEHPDNTAENYKETHFMMDREGNLVRDSSMRSLKEDPQCIAGMNSNSIAVAVVGDTVSGEQRSALQVCKQQLENIVWQPVTITGTPEFMKQLALSASGPVLSNSVAGLQNAPSMGTPTFSTYSMPSMGGGTVRVRKLNSIQHSSLVQEDELMPLASIVGGQSTFLQSLNEEENGSV